MEQSVRMSLPDARPIAHLLLNSSVTARAAVVPRPNNKAPAKADVMFLRIGFVLGVAGWGSLSPLIYTLLFDRRVHAVAPWEFVMSSAVANAISFIMIAPPNRIPEQFLEAIIISKALDYNTSRANSVRANKGNRRRDSQHRDRSGADSRTSRNGARHNRASRLLPNWGTA